MKKLALVSLVAATALSVTNANASTCTKQQQDVYYWGAVVNQYSASGDYGTAFDFALANLQAAEDNLLACRIE